RRRRGRVPGLARFSFSAARLEGRAREPGAPRGEARRASFVHRDRAARVISRFAGSARPKNENDAKGSPVEEFFNHPAVQGGVAPFVVGLIVAALLSRLRLGGLALAAAFFTAVYFVAGFGFSPLTATRKIFLAGLAAPVLGVVVDFLLRPPRVGAVFAV